MPEHLNYFYGNVHVYGLCNTVTVKEFGLNELLRPLVNEVKELQSDSGIQVSIKKQKFTLRACFCTVSADTLAAHDLFGLLSPAANHFCRLCCISKNELKNHPTLKAMLRSRKLHEIHLKQVKEDYEYYSTETGVKEDSIINELENYHFTEDYNFDILHDINEGHGNFALKLVAKIILSKKYPIDIKQFNERLDMFNYGKVDLAKKPTINFTQEGLRSVVSDHKLKQKANQISLLFRVVPFIFSDSVPADDP